MTKILLPAMLALMIACGSPDGQRKERVNESPEENREEFEMEFPRETSSTDLPEDVNQKRTFTFENDSVRQELTYTLESAEDMSLLYYVGDAALTCVLRYEGSATTMTGSADLQQQVEQLNVSYPARAYLFQDDLCSFVVFLADDRSKAEVKPIECEESYAACPAWSVGSLMPVDNPS